MITLKKTNPKTVSTFPSLFNDLIFNGFDNNFVGQRPVSVNIKESENQFNLELVVPGFKKEDINIELKNDLLTISSETSNSAEETDNETYLRREYSKSSFSRSFNIPETVDAEKIDADYKDGVLNIILPKKEESVVNKTKSIEIK